MVSKQPYQNLAHALKRFRIQVSESIPYALQNFPPLDTPEKIFNYLKLRTTYRKDPKGVELFQTLPTLLENNYHGTTGAGDCDCFTIAALSTLLANGFTDSGIVLAGRNPLTPVHIWAYTIVNGQRYELDLTNKLFNTTRPYSHLQSIPYKLNPTEKAMILELAEGPRRRRGSYHVRSYFRRYPLHEGGNDHPYIFLPNRGIQVREDFYDHLSAGEFQQLCLSEGVDFDTLQELSSKRAERKAAKQARKIEKKTAKMEIKAMKPKNVRKAARQDSKAVRKQTKVDTRQIKTQGKADIRTSRGQAKIVRADARVIRAQDPNRGQNFRAFTQAVFTPKQQEPEQFAPELPEDLPGMEPAYEPQYEVPEAEQYEQAYEETPGPVYYEQEAAEPVYQMAEGFSINRSQALTGAGLLVAGLLLDRLIPQNIFRR